LTPFSFIAASLFIDAILTGSWQFADSDNEPAPGRGRSGGRPDRTGVAGNGSLRLTASPPAPMKGSV